jgi:uncharacterized protein YjbJ (UPF0337 family)
MRAEVRPTLHQEQRVNSNMQQVKGRFKEAMGSVKEAIGKALGNVKLEASGKLQKNVGAWQAKAGEGEQAAIASKKSA